MSMGKGWKYAQIPAGLILHSNYPAMDVYGVVKEKEPYKPTKGIETSQRFTGLIFPEIVDTMQNIACGPLGATACCGANMLFCTYLQLDGLEACIRLLNQGVFLLVTQPTRAPYTHYIEGLAAQFNKKYNGIADCEIVLVDEDKATYSQFFITINVTDIDKFAALQEEGNK